MPKFKELINKKEQNLYAVKVPESKNLDTDEYIEKLENKNGSFIGLILSDPDKFVKLHSSGQYQWKFLSHDIRGEKAEDSSDNKIKTFKIAGWKVYEDDKNGDSRAVILYKKK